MSLSGCSLSSPTSSSSYKESSNVSTDNKTSSESTNLSSTLTNDKTNSTSTSSSSDEMTSSTTSSSSSSSSSISSSSSTEKDSELKFELSIPSLRLNEENGVVTWNEVEGAEYYNYVINDQNVKVTTGTTIELENRSNVSVQAVSAKDYSFWSQAVTYYDTSDIVLENNNSVYKVYFHDTNYSSLEVKHGEKVTRPTNPIKANYTFENWYADPFYTALFDFDKPITKSTVIYAHYTPNDLVNNVYYWVKANEKITSEIQSEFSSESGWKFIPLKEKTDSSIKEFTTIVNVSNASSSSPAQFLVMDGFDDNDGRTYYKNGSSDFKITIDGTYRITFSVETLYMLNGNQVNAKYEKLIDTIPSYSISNELIQLDTPVVDVDGDNNIAFISEVEGADGYEVIINNGAPKVITSNQVQLNKQEHISVRAFKGTKVFSNWSIPKANINYVYEDVTESKTHAYVYFYESNQNAKKVEINTYVDEITPSKDGYNFLGWYLDLAKTQKATFPYLVTENTVFYPKWEAIDNFLTKTYYSLVNSSGTEVAGLVLNIDNFDFYEYQAKDVYLSFGEQYYVKSLYTSKTWGPYTVIYDGKYNIYFSEEHIWNENTENESNIYFASALKTIYFSNSKHWSDTVYAYVWSSTTDQPLVSWPGTPMTYLETNGYGEQIYTINVDVSKYDMIIFSHGTDKNIVSQTIDISLTENTDNGFYVTSKNSSGKYEFGTYSR